ncbi:4'-phosphopantetheinyl transferase [Pedobacter sp. AK017]|uniref:4'-phosphopantetheinyl transferase family protein n=1 Tax=Pedobacter sp. AK017 TaxID=2723073 RepID=UPI001622C819|nr:4'-phosphopantetheinyl transferase superfamily protein [Pedobacter sp. AK017]MBB5441245.1 4'-phosphopantetheinyl transferase [Pedobacter sp. AK017]
MMKVYYARCDQQWYEKHGDIFLNQLPPVLRQRILRFKNWQDSCRSLVGKLLLKKALQECNQPATLCNLDYNEYGRPFVGGDLDFNLSHSGSYAVCAIVRGSKIGIDLEQIRPMDINHFQSQFNQEQWVKIVQSEHTASAFFHYWTLKEAVVKADGRGLKIPLQSIVIKDNHAEIQHAIWYYQKLSFVPEYVLHIACKQPISRPVVAQKINFHYDH